MDGSGPFEVAESMRISMTSEFGLITVSLVTSYFVIHGLDTPVTQFSSTNCGYITFLSSLERSNIELTHSGAANRSRIAQPLETQKAI